MINWKLISLINMFRRRRRRQEETTSTGDLVKFFDTDFGNSPIPTLSWFQARKAEGYEGFLTTAYTFWGGIPQPWSGTQQCLGLAEQAGLWIAAYGRPVERWSEALDNCGPYLTRLKFFQLDVEPEEDGLLHPVTRAMVDGVRARGVRPVVYTGQYMWADIMFGTTEFADVPLHDVMLQDDWPTSLPVPIYGGWSKRIGAQLRFEVIRDGIKIDDDVIERACLGLRG